MLYASICINNPSAYVKLRMFCSKHRIWKQTFPPVAKNGLRSALMTLHQTHVYNSNVFIDHTHWRSKNEKVAKIELLALNVWSPSLLKRPSKVR